MCPTTPDGIQIKIAQQSHRARLMERLAQLSCSHSSSSLRTESRSIVYARRSISHRPPLRRMMLNNCSVRRHHRRQLATTPPRAAENFLMLKHGVSPSSNTAMKLWPFKFTVWALCSTTISLRALPQDSAQPVQPESSAYDSALTQSACSTSTHSEASNASDGPDPVPGNLAGTENIEINELNCLA